MSSARDLRLEGSLVILALRSRTALAKLRAGTFDDADAIRLEVAVLIAEKVLEELEAEHLADVAAAGPKRAELDSDDDNLAEHTERTRARFDERTPPRRLT